MPTVLFSAPYMIPFRARFQPLFDHYGIELIVPKVNERMEAEQILAYAGQFDGTICGDDRYNAMVIQRCLPCSYIDHRVDWARQQVITVGGINDDGIAPICQCCGIDAAVVSITLRLQDHGWARRGGKGFCLG